MFESADAISNSNSQWILQIWETARLRMKIADATAGFKCYRRQVLEAINLDKIKFVGYAFQIEMKYRAFIKNFKIVEVPIIFTDRTKGQSKMSGGIIREAVVGVIMLRLRKIFNRL